MSTTAPVLSLTDLTVSYPGASKPAVDRVNVAVEPGRTLAIVGESGSGKSTTAAAAAGLSDPSAAVHVGTHTIAGIDMSAASPKAWRSVHGTRIGFVPQDAGTGLNPVRTISAQISHTLRTRGVPRRQAADRTAVALTEVGLDPALHGPRYPHELSGGQRQRALIALALAGEPAIVIADEPTSALDVTVQAQVLDLLAARVADAGAALVLITHDLGVAADRADDILVMQGGRIVESGPASQVLRDPQQAYTAKLLAAAPGLSDEVLIDARSAGETATVTATADRASARENDRAVLRADGITRTFGSGARAVRAAQDVSLELRPGRTVGIVGESGSGKSTTARILVGLEPADSGSVEVLGEPLTGKRGEAARLARTVRFVHQDPSASLDPKFTVAQSLAEPLAGFGIGSRADRGARIAELLQRVALDPELAGRRPRELSGGQRQRVAIARALAVDPQVVVLDEPVSALDVSVQQQILALLVDLQRELGLSYVFISHDLAVVRQIAHDVLVMADGRVVETGPTAEVFAHPTNAVTRGLIAAVPGNRVAESGTEATERPHFAATPIGA